MAERPILFSAPMVRAILAGRKTQTRRVLNLKTVLHHDVKKAVSAGHKLRIPSMDGETWHSVYPSIQTGDRLWVREAWRVGKGYDELPGSKFTSPSVHYMADGGDWLFEGRYRHARFMPRWASRITLQVTGVRVERLQDISEADAVAEGGCATTWASVIPALEDPDMAETRDAATPVYFAPGDDSADCVCFSAKEAFERLWSIINGPDAWDANPWVAAYTFERRATNG